jgi:hypothetical protein
MYRPLFKVYMTFKRVGGSIMEQRVQIGTRFVQTQNIQQACKGVCAMWSNNTLYKTVPRQSNSVTNKLQVFIRHLIFS